MAMFVWALLLQMFSIFVVCFKWEVQGASCCDLSATTSLSLIYTFPMHPTPFVDLRFGSTAQFPDHQASTQRIWSEGPRAMAMFVWGLFGG